jgi:hypothetical protein
VTGSNGSDYNHVDLSFAIGRIKYRVGNMEKSLLAIANDTYSMPELSSFI